MLRPRSTSSRTGASSAALYVQAHLSRASRERSTSSRAAADGEPTVDAAGVFRGGFLAAPGTRDREQGRLEISGFFGRDDESHEMTVGVGRRRAEVTTLSQWGAPNSVFLDDGSASGAVTGIFFKSAAPRITLDTNSIYVQDTLTTKNLIADVGMRYDSQEGEREPVLLRRPPGAAGPAAVDPSPPAPAARSSGAASRLEWDSRTASVRSTRPSCAPVGRASSIRWGPRCSTMRSLGRSSLPSRSPRFASSTPTAIATPIPPRHQSAILGTMGGTVIEPSLDAPLTDEVLFGAEHAGVGCFSIGGRLTWRRYRDLLDAPAVRARWRRRGAGGDPRRLLPRHRRQRRSFPMGTPYAVPVFALRPELELIGTQRLANGGREVEPLRRRRLAGASATQSLGVPRLRQRPRGDGDRSNRSCSRSTIPTDVLGLEDNDDAPFAPESVFADQSGVYLHSRWDYTIAGLYRARAGIGLSILAHGREGYPLLYFEDVLGSDGQTRSVAATDEHSPLRLDNVHQLDVRAEKELRLMGDDAAVTVSLDALNVLNRTPPLERVDAPRDPRHGFVGEIVAPGSFAWG